MTLAGGSSFSSDCGGLGHEWVALGRRCLECTRCGLFASEDGRAWSSRRAYEEEWARQLPGLRKSYLGSRVVELVYPQPPEALLQMVQSYLMEQGFEPQEADRVPPGCFRSKRARAGLQEVHVVAKVTEVEPGKARLRIQHHTLTPGFVTRFDSVRAVDDEIALAERLAEGAVRAFRAEAEQVFQSPF